jgi:ubiquinone biosynthesis protein UbiJ
VSNLHSPTLHTAGLAAAEAVANAALRLSPHSLAALRDLAGQVVAVECTDPALVVYIGAADDGQLRLQGVHDGDVTTRVSGSARDFAELASATDPAATLINGGLQLTGSSSTLLDLQRVISELDIDWEAPLVSGLGDVLGHQVAEMLRGAVSWSREASASLRRQLSEFALEEARLAPPAAALEAFYADVRQLDQQSERLERRVTRLRERVARLRSA